MSKLVHTGGTTYVIDREGSRWGVLGNEITAVDGRVGFSGSFVPTRCGGPACPAGR